MSTNACMLKVGGIEARILRKPIKHVHLAVLPPLGNVRVTAPVGMKDDAIRTLLATRLAWIRRQRSRFEGQDRQTKREYVSGESHYFLGRRYRLEVVHANAPAKVILKGKGKLVLSVRPGSDRAKREEVMIEWYREELRAVAGELMGRWQERTGLTARTWGIKRMRTRWGTCNQAEGRIWFNLELAKKPVAYTEYVVIHELLHLVEKKHGDKFAQLMTAHLPKWRSIKEELNRFILSHEKWNYSWSQ